MKKEILLKICLLYYFSVYTFLCIDKSLAIIDNRKRNNEFLLLIENNLLNLCKKEHNVHSKKSSDFVIAASLTAIGMSLHLLTNHRNPSSNLYSKLNHSYDGASDVAVSTKHG
jgi:hypothetical protein